MKNKEERKVYNRAYHLANLKRENARSRLYHENHREQANARMRVYTPLYEQALMAEAFRFLGDKCSCPSCGMSKPAFLTIDHINGRPKGSRKDALKEARASGWDKTKFQILCANCNFAKSDRGFCPVHQTNPGQRNGHNPDVPTGQLSLGF